jgi:formylglycine-generating enzyme required for sulfatase activity
LTGTGQIMGTVDYMAPEQAMDTRQADARSDVYSLGVTLWYLLAGRPLFAGETAMSRMMSHMQTPAPSLTAVRGDFTPEIDAVFQRMVAKQPADRFQSMQEVVAALQSLPRSQTAAGPRNPEFRGARGAPEHPDMAATQTLEQPPAAVGDENTTPLIAVDGDTAKGPRKIPPETRRSGFRPKPVHLAIGGGAVAALVLIGLMIHTFGGGRGSKPRDGEATSSGRAAVQAAAPPDAVTSGAATEPQPASNPAARPDPPAAARQPAPRPSPPPAVAPFDATQARKYQADWAEHLGIPVETVNSIGQTLVVIPPGKCTMGEGSETVEVTLTEPFLIGQTEVTQGQWTAVMGTAPWLGQLGATEGIDVPATNMTWEEAVQFCDTLTARDREGGRIGPAQVYRLPSEAETEFACRAGTTTAFSFGDDANQIGEYAWFGGGWDGRPIPGGNTSTAMHAHAVRQKRPNPWGLFDIHGNVFEWCFDWYADRANAPVSDPRGPSSGVDRVIRGGSWLYPAHSSRSANRLGYKPSGTLSTVGFRVVMRPPGTAPRDAPASAK